MLIDTHAHLDMSQFDPDRPQVIQRARDAGVECIITIATAVPGGDSVDRTMDLVEGCKLLRAGIGVHPHDAKTAGEALWSELEGLWLQPEVVLVGEIGLDYYYHHSPPDVQREVFRRQLRLARKVDRPVAIHCRDAWPDLVAILQDQWESGAGRGVMHSFTGNHEQALMLTRMGYCISFSGMVTFKSADTLREAARAVPADRILVETDSPYLAPVPHRGRRNEPAYVADVARALAVCRDVEYGVLASQTSENARRLFAPAP
jgi:TatD DNase family protein